MITRKEFEKLLKDRNVIELFSVFSRADLEELFGKDVAEMYEYDQNNPHHCYDLWNHTLHVIDYISPNGLDDKDYTTLRVAAFFHDLGKPACCKKKPGGLKSFHGHPQKSAELARPILQIVGYDEFEIERICMFIEHHDDFINFANKLPKRFEEDIFLREPSESTVREVLIKNMFDFRKMGYDEFEIQYIVAYISTGRGQKFKNDDEYIEFDVDIEQVLRNMEEEQFKRPIVPNISDYKLLMTLCMSDANAQSETCKSNGIDYSKHSKKNTIKRIMEILDHPLNFTFVMEMDDKEGEKYV